MQSVAGTKPAMRLSPWMPRLHLRCQSRRPQHRRDMSGCCYKKPLVQYVQHRGWRLSEDCEWRDNDRRGAHLQLSIQSELFSLSVIERRRELHKILFGCSCE